MHIIGNGRITASNNHGLKNTLHSWSKSNATSFSKIFLRKSKGNANIWRILHFVRHCKIPQWREVQGQKRLVVEIIVQEEFMVKRTNQQIRSEGAWSKLKRITAMENLRKQQVKLTATYVKYMQIHAHTHTLVQIPLHLIRLQYNYRLWKSFQVIGALQRQKACSRHQSISSYSTNPLSYKTKVQARAWAHHRIT